MKCFFGLLAVLVGAVLFTLGPVNSGYALSGPAITVSPVDYDAGDLTRAQGNVQKVFQVFNSGDSILSIAKIKYT
jgi:hypothetical protein